MKRRQSAFTVTELMVSTAILSLIMVILLQMTGQTANTWRYGAAKAEQFGEARKAFETMTSRLSEATLNTYWDYYVPPTGTSKAPTSYMRQSDLRFRVVNMPEILPGDAIYRPTQGVFFTAPLGVVEENNSELTKLDDLLNAWGYFVEINSTTKVPSFLASGYPKRTRSRLMEFRQPAEELELYSKLHELINSHPKSSQPPGGTTTQVESNPVPVRDPAVDATGKVQEAAKDDDWFLKPIKVDNTASKRRVRAIAENVLALVILPRLSAADEKARKESTSTVDRGRVMLTPDFQYHSKQFTNYTGKDYSSQVDPDLNPMNQLPPVVQVAMFAIDEVSAQRLAEKETDGNLGMKELFEGGATGDPLFTKSDRLESNSQGGKGDLQEFEQKLINLHLSYRLFSSNVAIRGSKWSRTQKF